MTTDPARSRFALLQAIRLVSALCTLLGTVVLSHAQPALAHWPDSVGDVLFVGGAIAFFAVPVLLAKHWKRQP